MNIPLQIISTLPEAFPSGEEWKDPRQYTDFTPLHCNPFVILHDGKKTTKAEHISYNVLFGDYGTIRRFRAIFKRGQIFIYNPLLKKLTKRSTK